LLWCKYVEICHNKLPIHGYILHVSILSTLSQIECSISNSFITFSLNEPTASIRYRVRKLGLDGAIVAFSKTLDL
jgi:hypothetical protein